MLFDTKAIIAGIIRTEGGYVNDPHDNGGETNFGITEQVARANGYTGKMIDMPQSFAETVYFKRYIESPRFSRVAIYSSNIASRLVDAGVNMGPVKAAIFLQRCLNVFNAQGSKYSDLFVDGNIGPATLAALNAYIKWRGVEGEAVLLEAIRSVQCVRYIELAEANQTQEDFIYGWIKNRIM